LSYAQGGQNKKGGLSPNRDYARIGHPMGEGSQDKVPN
jgi:hypothetical protein